MSDSITKWHEMQEDNSYIYESPDKGETVTRRTLGSGVDKRQVIQRPIVSEGHRKQAYQILVEYPQQAILEAARILKVGE
jgi:hypothetical protein